MLVKTDTKSRIMLTVLILVPMAGALFLLLMGGLWRITGIAILLAGLAFLIWVWWPKHPNS
jgi:uncharacterized membrane protein YjjP (DUF1212 family)